MNSCDELSDKDGKVDCISYKPIDLALRVETTMARMTPLHKGKVRLLTAEGVVIHGYSLKFDNPEDFISTQMQSSLPDEIIESKTKESMTIERDNQGHILLGKRK